MNQPSPSPALQLWVALKDVEEYIRDGIVHQMNGAKSFCGDDMLPLKTAYFLCEKLKPVLSLALYRESRRALQVAVDGLNGMLDALRQALIGPPSFIQSRLISASDASRLQTLDQYRLALTALEPFIRKEAMSSPDSDDRSLPYKLIQPNKVTILFVAADPTNASRLRLGEEFREIDEQLTLSRHRDLFSLALPLLSLRSKDIARVLLDAQPQIVHFSGHGTLEGALCFENEMGGKHDVQPDALAALFKQFADQVNCVVLSACYSDVQAKAIAEHINYVIGMNNAIGDKAAIAFALGFYGALGAGCTIEKAYKFGCVQIRLQGFPEHETPILIMKGQS